MCVCFSHSDEGLSGTGLRTGVVAPFESELASKRNVDVDGVGVVGRGVTRLTVSLCLVLTAYSKSLHLLQPDSVLWCTME